MLAIRTDRLLLRDFSIADLRALFSVGVCHKKVVPFVVGMFSLIIYVPKAHKCKRVPAPRSAGKHPGGA